MNAKTYRIKIGGDYACFSRPEFKAERVSYPVMTPSAARGAVEAIFWKPEIQWDILRIDVLNEIRETSILRNELDARQSMRQGPLVVEQHRQQRTTRLLRDVAYVVYARMSPRSHASEPLPKYLSQFERRLEKGQAHHTPYLGTREFAAWFKPAADEDVPNAAVNLDIGPMLFDLAFVRDESRHELRFRQHGPEGAREEAGYTRALFFDAKVVAGMLTIPEELHEQRHAREGD